MTAKKTRLHITGSVLFTRSKKRIEVTSAYSSSWMSEAGYHIKIDGQYARDQLGGIKYVTETELQKILDS